MEPAAQCEQTEQEQQARSAVARAVRLVLAYDGTDFHGWQRQPERRTVQGVVEDTLRKLLRHPLAVRGASRTDAGVHALGQVASFRTTSPIPIENLIRAVRMRLPEDVTLMHGGQVAADFDVTRDARGKLYRYRLFCGPRSPVGGRAHRQAWHFFARFDPDRLVAAAERMQGTHDFAGFASVGSPRDNTIRTVERVAVRRRLDEIWIDVEGDGFLYKQVRNMVGTMCEIARGLWPVERIDEILASRDRRLAGPPAPAHGLCLQWVRYRPEALRPDGA